MTLDEQLKTAQLEKLNRELALMPRSKLSMELLSKLFVPILAVAAAGYAFWIGLPKSQLDLLRAQREIVDSERKLADAERKRIQTEATRAKVLADIEASNGTLHAMKMEIADTKTFLDDLRRESADQGTTRRIDAALAQVARVDSSLTVAGERLSQAAAKAALPGSARYGAYNVDIFYCENAGERAKSRAEAVGAIGVGRTTGVWRTRALKTDANRRLGYRIVTDVIRHNRDESDVAQRLSADIRAKLGLDMATVDIASPTPGYLSMFFCDGARI